MFRGEQNEGLYSLEHIIVYSTTPTSIEVYITQTLSSAIYSISNIRRENSM